MHDRDLDKQTNTRLCLRDKITLSKREGKVRKKKRKRLQAQGVYNKKTTKAKQSDQLYARGQWPENEKERDRLKENKKKIVDRRGQGTF